MRLYMLSLDLIVNLPIVLDNGFNLKHNFHIFDILVGSEEWEPSAESWLWLNIDSRRILTL